MASSASWRRVLRRLVLGEHAFAACVHADEPLGGGAVDHRRLVAPAVRVAVRDGLGGEQAAGSAQRLDDQRRGLPDVQAAEQRQFGRIAAVALHRVQDVVVGHAVGDAGVEVFHAVGGRGMHDAGAVVGGGVVGQVDRAQAPVAGVHVVQRMQEVEQRQVLALRRGQHGAGELKALQAFLDQHGRPAPGCRARYRPARSPARGSGSAPGWPGWSRRWWSR